MYIPYGIFAKEKDPSEFIDNTTNTQIYSPKKEFSVKNLNMREERKEQVYQ